MSPKFAVLTTDLHLSEKPDDQYRFGLFDWIIQKHSFGVGSVIITGDLTDMKDRHADWFVNKVVDHVKRLSEYFDVYILKGNHDYYNDPSNPFFGFLDDLLRVTYIASPLRLNHPIGDLIFLPHTRTPSRDWKMLVKSKVLRGKNPHGIFCHQTFRGAKSESGYELDGISADFFKRYNCPVFSGDVHVPQRVGCVTYVGCPYHVHFGDKFKPRVMLLDERLGWEDVRFPAPRKLVLDIKKPDELMGRKIKEGDQVKVQLHLPRSDFVLWPEYRELVKVVVNELGAKLYSVTLKEETTEAVEQEEPEEEQATSRSHRQSFDVFCKRQNVKGRARDIGRTLME